MSFPPAGLAFHVDIPLMVTDRTRTPYHRHAQAKIAFELVAKIEAHHRARYEKIIKMVEAGTVYKREQPIKWESGVCGYIVEGTEPPPMCPSCKHPKEHYEPADMNI